MSGFASRFGGFTSGKNVNFIQHQKRKQLYLQHLVFVTNLLLSAAVVEDLELV
jgi:hypothetical protein